MRIIPALCILLAFFNAKSQSLAEVRKVFHEAVKDPKIAEDFYEFIQPHPGEQAVIKAYKAVAEAMVAQSEWNPISKFTHVKRFSDQIEVAVQMEDTNLEIRFLRFAVEFYLPPFLMMSDHLEKDRDFIIQNLAAIDRLEIDKDFARYIVYFMNETGMVEEARLEEIRASFAPH